MALLSSSVSGMQMMALARIVSAPHPVSTSSRSDDDESAPAGLAVEANSIVRKDPETQQLPVVPILLNDAQYALTNANANAFPQHSESERRVSAPRKKLFLSRKRRTMSDTSSEASSEGSLEVSKSARLTNSSTPRHALHPSTLLHTTPQVTRNSRLVVNDSMTTVNASASALETTAPMNVFTNTRVVSPEADEKPTGPTIRPLDIDYCFGPGTSRNPGNKALKHMAYYATIPFLQENARSGPNENFVIAKKVVQIWTGAGGRFLQSDDRSALWLPVTDQDFIVEKIRRSIGSWKGAWRHELKEGATGRTLE